MNLIFFLFYILLYFHLLYFHSIVFSPKVYAALTLVFLLALFITLSKIKVVEIIEGEPDPSVTTFKPLNQQTATGKLSIAV